MVLTIRNVMNSEKTILDKVNSGELGRIHVSAAASLGHAAALSTGIEPMILDSHFRTRIERVSELLTDQQCLQVAHNMASRTLKIWREICPGDERIGQVFDAGAKWMNDREPVDFRSLSTLASDISHELDYPELTEDVDPERCRAMHAADSIGHFVLAIHVVTQSDETFKLPEIIGWIARFHCRASLDPQREQQRLQEELASQLLQSS
ncbi:hypothetical protein ACYFX5_16370 [Bremerella sp. T1]|uniref:hypothetical protein n=1 Tax=Bremerella sp. TYQ1 TaxID=3119568 RepID=UPI001CC90E1E|nr:hypothetical protein [Bremerella volcania]UBM34633.1 hypothetical protein LA756_18320 [Bremerella volcania]